MKNTFVKAILVVSSIFSFFVSTSAHSDILSDARDTVEDLLHTWLPPDNYSDILKEADRTRDDWQSPTAQPSQPLQIFLHQAMYAHGGKMAHFVSEALTDFTPEQRDDQDYRLKAINAAVAFSVIPTTNSQNYDDAQFALYLMIHSRFPKVRVEAVRAIKALPLTRDEHGNVADIHNYLKTYLTFPDRQVRAELKTIVEKYHSPESIAYIEQEMRVSKLTFKTEFFRVCKSAILNLFR